MEKLPSSVHIIGQRVRIAEMPESEEENLGLFLADKRLIYVRTDLLPEVMADTLIHEFLHACFYFGNLKDDSKEEDIVTVFASLILGVLKDPRNQEFLGWIDEVRH
jgi:hypothetical protein